MFCGRNRLNVINRLDKSDVEAEQQIASTIYLWQTNVRRDLCVQQIALHTHFLEEERNAKKDLVK